MLDSAAVEAYRRDGVLVVPGVVTGEELERLRAAAARVVDAAVAHGRELDARGPVRLSDQHGFTDWDVDDTLFLYAADDDGRRVFRRAEGMFGRDPVFRAVAAHPALLAVVQALLGRPALPANDSLVVKMPAAGAAVPWHRDPTGELLLAERGDASEDFTCDLYLDESTVSNGALRALPGTHRGDGGAGVDPLDFDRPDAVVLEARPGDLLVHSTGVLHGSPRNRSGALRRTYYLHYRPADVLTTGWWSRPAEWVAAREREFAAMRAEREQPTAAR